MWCDASSVCVTYKKYTYIQNVFGETVDKGHSKM